MVVFLVVFFVAPMAFVALFAFGFYNQDYQPTGTASLANFASIWQIETGILFGRTAFVAGMVTLLSIFFAYPAAYYISEQPARRRDFLLMLLIIPFWTSFLLRTYALKAIFQANGLANEFLDSLGVIEAPIFDIGTVWAVIWAEVYTFLPFMALPLYATLERLGRSAIEASYVLGAGRIQTFVRVILPLSSPGILAGSLLVFVFAMGELVIPFLLGGLEAQYLIGNSIYDSRNVPGRSSALGLLFMGIVLAISLVYIRFVGRGGLRL
jgi:ABC-type spermidine/putrescine transport system permease subunit I